MTKAERNRRLATLTGDQMHHIARLIRNGYNARDIYNFRIGVPLRVINAMALGSIGGKSTRDETRMGGKITVLADVIQINSDGTERQPYVKGY